MAADPFAMLRTRSYVVLLVLPLLGVPIVVAATYFLSLIDHLQEWVFSDLPDGLGFDGEPTWWPIVPLVVAGFVVGATIRYLPGRGGHSPGRRVQGRSAARADRAAGHPPRRAGVTRAGRRRRPGGAAHRPGRWPPRTLVRLAKRDAPAQALAVVGAPAASPPSPPCSVPPCSERSC